MAKGAKLAMRNVLVIGRSGQLASALAQLSAEDFHVSCVGRETLDIASDGVGPALRSSRPDGVINASAYNLVDAAEEDPSEAFAVNSNGPTRLAETCADLGIPLVHVSTDYVFGDAKRSAYKETDEPAPMNRYGQSKLAGEKGVLGVGGKASVIRTCWVYSAQGRNFVTMMLALAREGREQVRVVEDQVGSPTFADDLAEACLAALKGLHAGDARFSGLLHYGGGGETSRAGFAESIFAGARSRGLPWAEVVRISAAEFAAAAPRPSFSALDSARAASLPGIRVAPWEQRLDACLDRIARQQGDDLKVQT